MNQKIPFHELAKRISVATSISDESAEVFIKNFFDLLGDSIVNGETVKIKGLGSFAVVDENGERVVSFIPDKDIADAINAPFAPFEAVELNDDVTDDMLSVVDSEDCVAEDMESVAGPAQVSDKMVEEGVVSDEKEPVQEVASDIQEATESIEIKQPETVASVEQEIIEAENTEIADKTVVTEMVEEEISASSQPEIPQEPVKTEVEIEQKSKPEPVKEVAKVVEPRIKPEHVKIAALEEEPEEYVEHVSGDNESGNGGFGWGFLVGLIVGLALGACAVYLAIDYLFPYGRPAEPAEREATEIVAEVIPEEPVAPVDSLNVEAANAEPAEGAKPESAAVAPAPVTEKPAQTTRRDTVRRGYLIHDMSKKYYGAKDFWVYIYEENKSKIGNPNKMQPGDVLVIPTPEKYGIDASSSESLKRARSKAGEILSKYK